MSLFVRYVPNSISGGGGGGSGTVTSVGLADASSTPIFAVSGSPVTTTGTLTLTLGAQSANTVFAGPTTGSAAQPAFRALVAADLPAGGNLTSTPTTNLVVTGGTGAVLGAGALLTLTGASLVEATSAVLTITGATNAVLGTGVSIQVKLAGTSQSGYLSSTDWNTFNGKGAGSVTSVAATVPAFLSISGSPITGSGTLAFTLSGTALPILNGGTGVTAVTIAPTATAFAGWDANKNLSATNVLAGYSTTATAAGTTVLAVGSNQIQYFTGVTTQIVTLPVTSTLVLGQQYVITNRSTGVVTVNSSGANAIQAMAANTVLVVTCILVTGTTAASWDAQYSLATATGTVTSVAMTVPAFLSIGGSPITTSGTLAVTLSGTALPIANGGTAKTAVTVAAAATSWAGWDANLNLSANNFISGFTTTATAAGTTSMTIASTMTQVWTGSTTQTVKLPTTSVVAGGQYCIINQSTGVVTVQSSGANTIIALATNTQAILTAVVATPTTAAQWVVSYSSSTLNIPVNPTTQIFTSGSGTYTTPAGVSYIVVEMVGAGGGGGGGGSSGNGNGGLGGTSTFGTSLLTCNGGTGATASGIPAAGGTATGGDTNFTGGSSGGANTVLGTAGSGGNSTFGCAGGGGGSGQAGVAASTNSGSGGGGGNATSGQTGEGGGAGGYLKKNISAPLATYSYAIGAAGTLGIAGTNGFAGGAGGSGYIKVTEYYPNLTVGTTSSVSAGQFLAGPVSGSAATPTFRALTPPTIQKFTSGSGTYTTSAGALYIKVKIIGGGGGGGGTGTSPGVGGTGGTSTFGTTLLSSVGGTGGGTGSAYVSGAGGTASLGSGPTGTVLTGGSGDSGASFAATFQATGGCGAASPLGGGGGGGAGGGIAGISAPSNTGTGGGGGGGGTTFFAGGGGGAGGWIDAIISTPLTTYSYSVGAAGTAGTLGTGGIGGGAGGSGYIEVTEYYQ